MPIKKIIVSIILFLILSTGSSKAACFLESIDNLSIDNQVPNDVPNIIRLQSILYSNNLYDGPITGYYGNLTKTAINKLKKSYNLSANGIVDSDTINILCENYKLCPFQSLLQNGDEYPTKEIKFIQSFLKLLPNIYPEKLVTGYFGAKTENAVKRLQKQLNISQTGKIDELTKETFCNFFASFGNNNTGSNNDQNNITKISKVVCVPSTKQAKINETITFMSQIIGNNNTPFKYIWNNKTSNNQKTFETAFSTLGDKTISLKVIDNQGQILTAECKINIQDPNAISNDTDEETNLSIDIDLDDEDSDDIDIDNQTQNNTTPDIPTDVEKYIFKNWTTFLNLNTETYPLTIDPAIKFVGDYRCFSYEEVMTIVKDDQTKYKTYAKGGPHPNNNLYDYFKTHYYNMYTQQCVHSSYILKDASGKPCYYYQGPFYYHDCNNIGNYTSANFIYIDGEWKYRKQKINDSDYIDFDLTWDDFKSCHPYYSKQTLLLNSNQHPSIDEPITNRNLKILTDGNIKFIKYPETKYSSELNYVDWHNQSPTAQSQDATNTNIQIDSSSQSSSSTGIKYTYIRHKCSTEGCIPCDPKEWCQFDSYGNCLDYCWAERGKVQMGTERSDTPRDYEPIKEDKKTDQPSPPSLLPKPDDSWLSGKYRCFLGLECKQCTLGELKTHPACWFNSLDECKAQCGNNN